MIFHIAIMCVFYASSLIMLRTQVFLTNFNNENNRLPTINSSPHFQFILWSISKIIFSISGTMNSLMVYYICWSFARFAEHKVLKLDQNNNLTFSNRDDKMSNMSQSSVLQSETMTEDFNQLTYSEMRLNEDVAGLLGRRSDKLDF